MKFQEKATLKKQPNPPTKGAQGVKVRHIREKTIQDSDLLPHMTVNMTIQPIAAILFLKYVFQQQVYNSNRK